MFTGIDVQGKSLSLRDPTQKLKLQQQQLVQGQILGPIQQKEGLLPTTMNGYNQIGQNNVQQAYQANGNIQNGNQGLAACQISNQQLIQNSATKQPQKYNLPMNNQQQFKIGHQNKLDFMRQQQAQKYNQNYQLDTQLQQQQQLFQQQQYIQNLQLQQQLQMSSSQIINNGENISQLYTPYNNNGNNSTVLQQYLSGQKQINNNQNRENSGQNHYHSESSPKTTSSNFSNQYTANTLRNQNINQQQNDYRFSQIQQFQQNQQLQQQQFKQQQGQQMIQQIQQQQNQFSQSPMPLQTSYQQPVVSLASYFNQQQQQIQQCNNNQTNGQQQTMFASSENFAQKNPLYSCIGNPNNPYNNHLNNPYLQEKRYLKSSKLPKIRKQKGQQATTTEIRSVSLEKQSRLQITASINQIVNQNGGIGVQNTNNENVTQGKSQNQSNLEKSTLQVESNIQVGSKSTSNGQSLVKQQSLTNIPLSTKDNNQLCLASNQISKKVYENINIDDDEEDKQKCIIYFRYNLGQLLNILSKKEAYFSYISNKKPIKTYNMINQPLGQKHLNHLPKNTIAIINKVKKIVATKGKYKYRERFNFSHSAQLKSINYDVRRRLSQIQDKKMMSNAKQKDEEESSDSDDTPVKARNNNKDTIQQTDLAKWKKFNRLDPKTKVFIIKGGYGDLRRALLDRGWVENPDHFSPCFDFKWTCKVQDVDYDNLMDFQIVNHFDNNQVFTSKYGLARNLRTLIHSDNIDVYKFFPRCFDLADLQEFEDFIENFKVAKAESLVYKFKDMLMNEQQFIDDKLELKIRLSNEIVTRKYLDFYEQVDFIFNQELFPCVSPEEWEIISKDDFQLDQKKIETYLDRLRAHPSFKYLYSQNKQKQKVKRKGSHAISTARNYHDPIEEESIQSSSSLKNQEQPEKQCSKSSQLLELCNQTLQKSKDKDPQHHLNGYRNIWIVKPNFLSRGRGIKCFNNLDKIMDYVVGKETQFVVQKYIENPLLINNKKFDMRQWAIVQDFCPPRIWFFDECYIRLCSVEHNIDDLNNKFVHLTNNVIQKCNKEGYSDKDELMMSQEQFAEYLKETEGRDIFYDEIQPKLKQMIIQSLRCCQDQVGARKNSMEFIGYDFMVDSNYQPWLIEINSSPSMEYSTTITKELVQRVLEDTTKVVVDYSLAKKGTKKNVDTGGFKLIYKGEKQQKTNKIGQYKK